MASSYWERIRAKRVNRRRFLASSAAGAGGAALLAACGGDDDGDNGETVMPGTPGGMEPGSVVYERDFWQLPDETAQAVRGGVYPGIMAGDTQGTLDANLEAGPPRSIGPGIGSVVEFLTRQNNNPGVPYGSPEYAQRNPHLALSVDPQPGGQDWVLTRRRDIHFHDIDPVNGREMDVEDWRLSFERFLEVNRGRAVLLGLIDSMELPDDDTMVLHLTRPYGLLRDTLAAWSSAPMIMPKELSADPDLAATVAIGTGFMQMSEWQRDIRQVFVKNPNYWQGDPFIDRWVMSIVPEYSGRFGQFVTQQTINFIPEARDVVTYRNDVPGAFVIGIPPTTEFVRVSRLGHGMPEDSPFRDPRVRIAFRRCCDLEGLADFLAAKDTFAAEGIDVDVSVATAVPPDPTYYLDPRRGELGEFSQNYLFGLDEARKLMEAAGYPDGIDVDGWTSDTDAETDRLLLHKDMLDQSGLFRVDLHVLPFQQFFQDILLNRDFDGVAINRTHPTDPFDYHMLTRVSSETGNPIMPDPNMDELARRYMEELDPAARIQVLKDYQMYHAEHFLNEIPADGNAMTWRFEWPWLHNPYHWGHLQWLAEDMPQRDG